MVSSRCTDQRISTSAMVIHRLLRSARSDSNQSMIRPSTNPQTCNTICSPR